MKGVLCGGDGVLCGDEGGVVLSVVAMMTG